MYDEKSRRDSVKHTIRNLKKSEIRIRFLNSGRGDYSREDLVWNNFFDIKPPYSKNAKYTLSELMKMSKEDYKAVIEEFYWNVYYRMFKENYYGLSPIYDVDALSKLGLSPYANMEDIKTRFRELAKKYHPDAGGSKEEFIELYKIYSELKDR